MKEVKKSTNIADGVKNLIAAANADYTDRTNHDGLSYNEQSDSQKASTTLRLSKENAPTCSSLDILLSLISQLKTL